MRCCHKKRGARKGGSRRPLLFGMLAGVLLGLMFAPRPGGETIRAIREKALRKLPV